VDIAVMMISADAGLHCYQIMVDSFHSPAATDPGHAPRHEMNSHDDREANGHGDERGVRAAGYL
jgi:hypothetical protein